MLSIEHRTSNIEHRASSDVDGDDGEEQRIIFPNPHLGNGRYDTTPFSILNSRFSNIRATPPARDIDDVESLCPMSLFLFVIS
uniref:Uncharacterized protein n=1 Tax=Psilocybe cubensis TaxID=181762 RepID=A0A8H7XWC2_PSICU